MSAPAALPPTAPDTGACFRDPIESRFLKFIIIYVDGRCRPNIDRTPVDQTGDLCERGTFYMDSPLGELARMETNLRDLMDHIDATFRTRSSSAASVVDRAAWIVERASLRALRAPHGEGIRRQLEIDTSLAGQRVPLNGSGA